MDKYILLATELLLQNGYTKYRDKTDLILILLKIDSPESLELVRLISGVAVHYVGCNTQSICDYNCSNLLGQLSG